MIRQGKSSRQSFVSDDENGNKILQREKQMPNGLSKFKRRLKAFDSDEKFITEDELIDEYFKTGSEGNEDKISTNSVESLQQRDHKSLSSTRPVSRGKPSSSSSSRANQLRDLEDVSDGRAESSNNSIDIHHLVNLNQFALIQHGKKLDQRFGRDKPQNSPYVDNINLLYFNRPFRKPSNVEILIRFHGKLPGDKYQPKEHEVLLEQLPFGNYTATLFRKLLLPESNFTIRSRRNLGAPFSLTFYIDGIRECQINSCCEYPFRDGCRIGPPPYRFTIITVQGAKPCSKCRLKSTPVPAPVPVPERKNVIVQQHTEKTTQTRVTKVKKLDFSAQAEASSSSSSSSSDEEDFSSRSSPPPREKTPRPILVEQITQTDELPTLPPPNDVPVACCPCC